MSRQQIDALMNEEMQVVMLEMKLSSDKFMKKLKAQTISDRIRF